MEQNKFQKTYEKYFNLVKKYIDLGKKYIGFAKEKLIVQYKKVMEKIRTAPTKDLNFFNLKKIDVHDNKNKDKKHNNKHHKKIVNKRRFIMSCSGLAIIVFAVVYLMIGFRAYEVSINGQDIGKVRSKKAAEKIVLQVLQDFQKENKSEVNLVSDIKYQSAKASAKQVLSDKSLYDLLKKNIKYSLQSYSIYVNGKAVATLKSKEAADGVLANIKNYYLSGVNRADLKEISFAETVEVKPEFSEKTKILEKAEAEKFILKGTNEERIHVIESGESFWTISRKYNMTVEQLMKANVNANPEKVKIGQALNLVLPKPLVSVKTIETKAYTDNSPYQQKVELSSSLYKNETSVKRKGKYGERQIVASVVKVNGIEKSRMVLSEKEVKPPVDEIIVKGTKPVPAKKGTGTFAMPTRGSLTSRFGFRWGRKHEGIDLGAAVGTKVRAADGGTVIWAGYEGGYGKLIKIDHGGGFVSFYGHLSKISIKKGDKIFKGQLIGAVGNTGRSTGPHLHFQITKFGVPVNPLKYIN